MSLFVRRDLQALRAEAGAGTLRRELGPFALVTLGIGAVIGAGIFVLSGNVASPQPGPHSHFPWYWLASPAPSPGCVTPSWRV